MSAAAMRDASDKERSSADALQQIGKAVLTLNEGRSHAATFNSTGGELALAASTSK
jgi:hypothetical protein